MGTNRIHRASLRRLPCASCFFLLTLFACTSLSLGAGLGVAELAEMDIEALMDIKVISVAKKEQKQSESAAAVYVITQEAIRRSGVTSVPEALRMAPGVQVARLDANKWAVGIRGFNSRFANKLLVMIDGRTVYTPLFSGVYWDVQDLLLEDIDRIEVVRGPGATLWGANAVNGVINIITKSAHDTRETLVTTGGGSEEHGFVGGRHGGRLGENASYRVYSKYVNRDSFEVSSGSEAEDDWDQVRGGFRIDWDASEDDVLVLHGDIYSGTAGSTFTTPTLSPPFTATVDRDTDVAGGHLVGRWTRTLSQSSDVQVQAYYDRTERDSPFIREERDTLEADAQHRFALTHDQEVVWGVGYRYTTDDIKVSSPTFRVEPDSRGDNLVSSFVQDEIELVDERLRLIVGSKFEHNDYTGFEVQPSGRLVWTPADERQTLWGAVSRAVRTPSRVEDDFSIDRAAPPPGAPGPGAPTTLTRLVGSGDFDAEELLAYELGYRLLPNKQFSIDVATFINIYDNLRTFEPAAPFPEASPPPPHLVLPLIVDNKMDGETYGVEVMANWQASDRWRLEASYTFLEMDLHLDRGSGDTTSQDAEGQSPENQFSLKSLFDLTDTLELDATCRYVDRLSSLDVDSYVTLDLHLGWKASDNVVLAIVGQNLVESRHQEFGSLILGGVPSESPRSVYGKVTIRM